MAFLFPIMSYICKEHDRHDDMTEQKWEQI